MRPPIRRLALAAALAAAVLHLPSARAAEPWDGPAFSADPKQLLAAAQALTPPRKAHVDFILEDVRFRFDEGGRRETTTRLVFRVLTRTGAEGWANLSATYSPWLEERPEILARVITPAGAVHQLDPKTLSEEAARNEPGTFSDRRSLTGPLPAMEPGALVEEVFITRQTRPFFQAGERGSYYFGREVPVRISRLVLDVGPGVPFRHAVQATAAKPETSAEGGRTLHRYELRDLAKASGFEPMLPPEVVPWPRVVFSTARSWAEVARGYSEVVDRQLKASAGAFPPEVKALTRGGSRQEIANRLLAWLRKHVRYTGIELGEGAIVPRTPEETLARRYGDCKDMSAILVALLRSAGMDAHVALLSPGWTDFPPDLPGLGAFTHAVVVVSGKEPIWMDPTDSTAAAGDLPAMSHERQTLIASPSTRGLTRTPPASPRRNLWIVQRDYHLSELGPSRVVEKVEVQGSLASERRQRLVSQPEELRKQLEEYARTVFDGKKVSRFEHSDPEDLTRPLTITTEASEASRGYTGDEDATLFVSSGIIFEHLPSAVGPYPPEEKERKDGAEEKEEGEEEEDPRKPRKHPVLLPEPHLAELRVRIHAPPGFALRAVPETERRAFGPFTMKRTFKAEPDGGLSGVVTMDFGKARLSPDEVAALRKALTDFFQENALEVTLDRTAEKLFAAGQVKEALVEQRRLIALHPQEGLHHAQLASLLLRAGAAEAARESARTAVKLEPSSATAHRVLGWVLEHDLLGRYLRKGSDFPGAIAAFRRTKELDPEHAGVRAELALLLEHDADGRRYSKRADLNAAIAEYQSLRKDLEHKEHDEPLLTALLRAGRFKDLRAAAGEMEQTAKVQALSLAAQVAQDGVPAAVAEAGKKISSRDTRRTVLLEAADLMVKLRRYESAAALMTEALKINTQNQTELQLAVNQLARIKRHEGARVDEGDPISPILRMGLAIVSESLTTAVPELLGEAIRQKTDPKRVDEQAGLLGGALHRTMGNTGVSTETIADFFFSAEFRREGDERTGYRVEMLIPMTNAKQVFFTAKEGGKYRIIGFRDDPSMLGLEAQARAARGDLAGARRLLDWGRAELPESTQRLPPASAAFAHLWKRGVEAPADQVKIAAAALTVMGGAARHAVPALEAARAKAEGEAAAWLDLLLAIASLGEDWKRVLDRTEKLASSSLYPDDVFRMRVAALRSLRRYQEAEKLAAARLEKSPDDAAAQEWLITLAADRGDFAGAEKLAKKLIDAGKASHTVYNNAAWYALFRPDSLQEAIQRAEHAVSQQKFQNRFANNTLAALYAEVGRAAEARPLALRAVDQEPDQEPNDAYWYVFGRIAEGYGLTDVARASYQRVKTPEDAGPDHSSHLARRRLAALPPP